MKELYQKYAFHLDELRIQSKIKVFDFCDGICDDRTYRRYLSGDLTISQKRLNSFCLKLGFSTPEFFASYNRMDVGEYQKVVELYGYLGKYDYLNARKIIIELEQKTFVNDFAKRFFAYCVIQYNNLTNSITKALAYEQFSTLIDYPACLQRTFFNIIDTLCLQQLAMLELHMESKKAQEYLYTLLIDRKFVFVTMDNRHILPVIYSTVSWIFGMSGEFQKSLDIAESGIAYCIVIDSNHDLDKLYYYQSLCLFKLNHHERSKHAARKCLATLISSNNKPLFQKTVEVMSRDFGFNPIELLHINSVEDL